jgi:hypothetical protein
MIDTAPGVDLFWISGRAAANARPDRLPTGVSGSRTNGVRNGPGGLESHCKFRPDCPGIFRLVKSGRLAATVQTGQSEVHRFVQELDAICRSTCTPKRYRRRIRVEPRTINSGSKVASTFGTVSPLIWAFSDSTAAALMAWIGCRSVVSGGSVAIM